MIRRSTLFLIVLFILQKANPLYASEANGIQRNAVNKIITITVPDKSLSIVINYAQGCVIKELNIKGHNTLSSTGVITGIKTKNGSYFSNNNTKALKVSESANHVIISGISYGNDKISINETWNFELKGKKILWSITRNYNSTATLDDMAFPQWNFANLNIWKGGILDNGGMVWCKYLGQVDDTYGVHTGGVTFWNATSGDGLQIAAKADNGKNIAAKYSHSGKDEFTCAHLVTDSLLQQRYNLSRFVSKKADVFAPFSVGKGSVTVQYELQYVNYFAKYSRGKLPGIDAGSVRELLNTTGRYGVVDNNIVGGNGWLSNWKCMHEPFFAQIGLAVDDKNYTHNLSATLNQERDLAMLADGRMLSRWHNVPGDEIPGTYNAKTGYYEAMWGYTVDSQTGYVINAGEQFDINGDVSWLKSHQKSCEMALEWLIKRDSNHNGIFEMVNDNIADQKASDWLDIVYASYENAFVNAQMYEALTLWAKCEKVLGDTQKSNYYTGIAARLKTTFNKPVEEGGFWSTKKKQYVYWRDKDGSVHGDNLVTPVNFAVIAFGICDDQQRIATILDNIEQRTVAEKLFHWPLCFDSFKQEEVQSGNWPFPRYENGDIFPTWGYMGIRAYAGYDKNIALKYIRNILEQYKKDGLSSQRYSRLNQQGMGDDVLAGICTTVTGLYRDIYGIRPKWNRMGLEPNMTRQLNGTQFSYTLRDTLYRVSLNVNNYKLSSEAFSINSTEGFGAGFKGKQLTYYHHNQDSSLLQVTGKTSRPIALKVHRWTAKAISWTVNSADAYRFKIRGLAPNACYSVSIDEEVKRISSDRDGELIIKRNCSTPVKFIIKQAGT
jgi:hypothetical protein